MRISAYSWLALGLFTTLSACGPGGNVFEIQDAPNGPISAAEAERLANAYTRQSGIVFAVDPTEDLGMPNTGQAVFDGKASLVVTANGASDAVTFVGDATVRADFGQTSVFAQMDSFSGTALNGRNLRLDGEILMSDGRIGDGSPSNISGLYRGTVMGSGVTIQTSGALFGKFRDTPVAAVSLSGSDGNARYNGDRAVATLTAVAQ